MELFPSADELGVLELITDSVSPFDGLEVP